MVVVAVVLGMLAFGKTGYAKSIQDAILGSTNHIVETGENITKKEVNVKAGDIVEIDGNKYIVIEQKEKDAAFVMTVKNIDKRVFHQMDNFDDEQRQDGKNPNTYEGSDIDNYLENDWYNGLSSTMKSSIQRTNIKQSAYHTNVNPDDKRETGYKGQTYNIITRHIFLPSVEEIEKLLNIYNNSKVIEFLDGDWSFWLRDAASDNGRFVRKIYSKTATVYDWRTSHVYYDEGVRPAFVIDLSKIDYTEVGHVDYK